MPRVFCSLLMGIFCCIFTGTALLGAGLPDIAVTSPEMPAGDTATGEITGSDAAAAEISGSTRPGILDHRIIRPGGPGKPLINISYPSLGRNDIDADIRHWATGIADAFEKHLDTEGFGLPGGEGDAEQGPSYELWGSYNVSRPSEAAISLTFEIWTYTGGSHGNQDIITLNYSLITGQRLGLVDLFEDPEAALQLMSAWSYRELSHRLGGGRLEQMLKDGTAPTVENFSSLTLTPEGLLINFQPYQVAPWAAGAQKVEMPLDELLGALPLLSIWGR